MNAHLAVNLALDKATFQRHTYISLASHAVDGDNNTASCAREYRQGQPWWAVDLGQEYDISSVIIIAPDVNGDKRNYRRSCFIH